ncbi:MAG: hypothetical protein LBV54_03200 [Puniceicoccales bacterium]|jgi:hypothetical protein|nr:hypothetical protein [Puniceicoccales bacterium]
MKNRISNATPDSHLDALLAQRPVSARPDFADDVLRAIESDNALDAIIDERLLYRPLRATPALTERLFPVRTLLFRRLIRVGAPFAAALLAGIALIPAFLHKDAPPPAIEEIIARAISEDPSLAILLNSQNTDPGTAPVSLDSETASAVSGINDNVLVWLETLAYYEK